MTPVTISPKFQIVIPKNIREGMDLKPGMKCELIRCGGTIRIVPVVPITELRGAFKGMDTTIIREPDREL
ncbi:MAG: AbrB/MazE/SpoVT family DNA-binding domain-containing protein [Candidatus Peregrinibacteria bacterium]|nr:AbrB/MazE/SpoVT family DNA-binding domain-containing protein [Candidatus Peregrinibacteria bacterium]